MGTEVGILPSGSFVSNSEASKGSNKMRTIAIAVGVCGEFLATVICITACLCYHKKEQTSPTSEFISRTKSSDPSYDSSLESATPSCQHMFSVMRSSKKPPTTLRGLNNLEKSALVLFIMASFMIGVQLQPSACMRTIREMLLTGGSGRTFLCIILISTMTN